MPMTIEQLRNRLAQIPRLSLAALPTPLQEAPHLSAVLNGPRIFIKRDDMTGLAFGGNKSRMLEFILAEAQAQEADTLVVCGGLTSNFCRQAAAAAAKLGWKCAIVLAGPKPWDVTGNILLEKLLGAEVRFVDTVPDYLRGNPPLTRFVNAVAEEYRNQGHNPYVVESSIRPISVLGYVNCAVEMVEQFDALNLNVSRIYVASMSSTQAGLELGFKLLGRTYGIVSMATKSEEVRRLMSWLANEAARILGVEERIAPEDLPVNEGSFAREDPEILEAIRLAARTEGLITDPVYTGKVVANLIREVRSGEVGDEESVVFLHTGGTPIVFTYGEKLLGNQTARFGPVQ
jgi:1-aminocyclopropane-1-carboxylate deaminase/D-cysteine desulfhydrase-like pyridoxal-dependent ACC family enzyme